MDTYELVYEENIEGLTVLSLVNMPAVKYEMLRFADNIENHKFAVVDEEKRMAIGVALLADTPLLRNANKVVKEDHYITMSKDTIEKLVINYFEKNAIHNVSGEHSINIDNVFIYQSILVDKEKGVLAPTPFKEVTDGSWIVALKVNDDDTWNKIKSGEYKGISVEGEFMYDYNTDEIVLLDQFKELYHLLKQIK